MLLNRSVKKKVSRLSIEIARNLTNSFNAVTAQK